jgi:hypothetical protein
MRKVLLATTALVAMSVTGAQAADISISGNLETNYLNTGGGDSFLLDGVVYLTATTAADNGVSYEVVWGQRIEPKTMDVTTAAPDGKTLDTGHIQQASLKISSADIGSLYLGQADDDAPGMMDGALPQNIDIESTKHAKGSWETALGGGEVGITWISPNVGGFQIGATTNPGKSTDATAVTYSMGGVSAYYGTNGNRSNVGVKGEVAGFTIAVGASKVDGTKTKTNDMGFKYSLANGITLAGLVAKGTDANGAEKKYNNVGASYTLAPGVSLKVEAGEADNAGFTFIGVNTAF